MWVNPRRDRACSCLGAPPAPGDPHLRGVHGRSAGAREQGVCCPKRRPGPPYFRATRQQRRRCEEAGRPLQNPNTAALSGGAGLLQEAPAADELLGGQGNLFGRRRASCGDLLSWLHLLVGQAVNRTSMADESHSLGVFLCYCRATGWLHFGFY